MTSSLEVWPTKVKEAPSPHEVRLTPLATNPVFQCLGDNPLNGNGNSLQSFLLELCENALCSWTEAQNVFQIFSTISAPMLTVSKI